MSWRSALSVILAVIGGLGPAVILLIVYGPKATLKSIESNEASLTLTFLGLMLASLVCGLGAGVLMRNEWLAQLRSFVRMLTQANRRTV